jgi:hypothetical protein
MPRSCLPTWRETCNILLLKGHEGLLSVLRKLFFWNYARNTWQWDVLCVVILIFIFLTPKSWFENSERRPFLAHQNPTPSIVLIGAELIENAQDKGQLEQVVRTFTGRSNIQVLNVRTVVDKDGRIRGYEVDIR